MNDRIFQRYRTLIYEMSGISLGPSKHALVSSRVAKRMRVLGMDDHAEYLDLVAHDSSGQELVQLLDAISTNVTSFFREEQHFQFMAQHLRTWHEQGQRRFRVWSAASSTGEEPYSILMCVAETLGDSGVDMRLLATDISTRALGQAKAARYREDRMRGVTRQQLLRFFTKEVDNGVLHYRVTPALRKQAAFARLNLSQPPFPMKGPMDFIFIRNVMIYFDNHVRQRLVAEAERLLRPGGFLFVGHAESLTGLQTGLKSVQPAVYRK